MNTLTFLKEQKLNALLNTQLEISLKKSQATLVLMDRLDILLVLYICASNKGRTIHDIPKSWKCELFRCQLMHIFLSRMTRPLSFLFSHLQIFQSPPGQYMLFQKRPCSVALMISLKVMKHACHQDLSARRETEKCILQRDTRSP